MARLSNESIETETYKNLSTVNFTQSKSFVKKAEFREMSFFQSKKVKIVSGIVIFFVIASITTSIMVIFYVRNSMNKNVNLNDETRNKHYASRKEQVSFFGVYTA